MFELRVKTWLNKEEVRARVRKATAKPLQRCAALVESEAKQIVSKGAQYTVMRDGGGRFSKRVPTKNTGEFPRIITGNLRSSIQYAQTPEGTWVVGPTFQGWYGRVHEFGAVINVTPRQRGFLQAQFGWTVGSTIIIKARPFMRPALTRVVARFPEEFRDLPIDTSRIAEKNT